MRERTLDVEHVGKPLVSVVTIVYNNADTLEQTIQSVIAQTYSNIEHIIIDGGSDDGTLDVVQAYGDDLAYWETGQDGGISDAFNRGVARASGEFISCLNADDWYHEQTIQVVLDRAELYPEVDVFYGDVCMVRGDGIHLYRRKAARHLSRQSFAYRMPAIHHPTVFAKRRLYRNELFDVGLNYAMDYDWLRRLYRQDCTFMRVPTTHPLTYMRITGQSNNSYDQALQEVYEITLQHGDNRLISFLYNRVFRMLRYRTRGWMEQNPLGQDIVRLYRESLVRVGLRKWEIK